MSEYDDQADFETQDEDTEQEGQGQVGKPSEDLTAQEQEELIMSALGPPEFDVMGHIVKASFTFGEFTRYKAFAVKQGLRELDAEISKLSERAEKELRQPGALISQEALIASLEKGMIAKLKKLERDPINWTDEDEAALDKYGDLLDRARTRFDTVRQDPAFVLEVANRHNDELEGLLHKRKEIALAFVHELVQKRGGKDTRSVKEWKEQAGGQDLTNAYEVVHLGNVQHSTSGAKAQRHWTPPSQRRKSRRITN